MSRADLLTLNEDDLASLTNRGTVRRATKELHSGKLTYEICLDSADADFVVRWSDGTTCTFPSGKTIHEAQCSSGTLGISRHIIRSVLAYQLWNKEIVANESGRENGSVDVAEESIVDAPWDPGGIADQQLETHFGKRTVSRAKAKFAQGVLVECTRGRRPTARFLHESAIVRFPVPNDVRYATGDCSEATLPYWVLAAVWSFRELPIERKTGLLSLGQAAVDVPQTEILRLGVLLQEWLVEGFSNLSDTWSARMARAESDLREVGLIWPAEIVLLILEQQRLYQEHDARFSEHETVDHVGELIARLRAIQSHNSELPTMLVRGSAADARSEMRSSKFTGLGLDIRESDKHTTLVGYFQDSDSGSLAVIKRSFRRVEESEQEQTFEALAKFSIQRGVSISAAALSQLLVQTAKRTPADELILPRGLSKLSVHAQAFQWEKLLPPVAVEGFQVLREKLAHLPPNFLRARKYTENFHVCAVAELGDIHFDVVRQRLTAEIQDPAGDSALLEIPFYSRGDQALQMFEAQLETHSTDIRFVSGIFRLVRGRLHLRPVAIVYDSDKEQRYAMSPWIAAKESKGNCSRKQRATGSAADGKPIAEFQSELLELLGDTLITGLTSKRREDFEALASAAHRLGFSGLPKLLRALASKLALRAEQRSWQSTPAAEDFVELLLLQCVFSESSA